MTHILTIVNVMCIIMYLIKHLIMHLINIIRLI